MRFEEGGRRTRGKWVGRSYSKEGGELGPGWVVRKTRCGEIVWGGETDSGRVKDRSEREEVRGG